MKRLACALVLASSACALTGVQYEADASPTRATDKLLLSILTPDPATIGDHVSLDVTYRGSAVDTVELYLDNALVAQRRINTAQTRGIISFSLDTLLLTAGSHEVSVKAYAADGKATSASTRLRIPQADLSAPVRIAYPQNGTAVYGVVPVRVALDSDIQKLKPYVTFFVDKELKKLTNYPPYEFTWDTTRVSNGWHLLEAWSQTDDSISPLKARAVRVNVNNASGETRKQNGVEDLRAEPKGAPITLPIGKPAPAPNSADSHTSGTKPVNPATARTDGAAENPGIRAHEARVETPTAGAAHESRIAEPSTAGLASTAEPTIHPSSRAAAQAPAVALGPRMAGGAAAQPGDHMMVASRPKGLLPGFEESIPPITFAAAPRAASLTIAVRPNDTLEAVSSRTGISQREIARLNGLKPGARLKGGDSLIVPRAGSFDVAFDGTPIVFDVRPRIEGGLKLAPFRQIFEHTGGRLYWFGGTAQTVRAVNDTREIEIKIGDRNATVNNHNVTMEHKPFIESGRTIVPLSFIHDSMNVKISYDEKTGRLLIESNK